MAYSKSDLVARIYREKEVGEASYTGDKRVASSSEKSTIQASLGKFLAAVVAKHS
jgi:hypothetical protein|tara:strand:- start:1547 stop:1711 length:165 start_codon:yes stop_codon:yes gene_type:complete